MKNISKHCCLIFINALLISCADQNEIEKNALPIKEIHYDGETNMKIGEKILNYDDNGNLIKEHYHDLRSSFEDKEVLYEYNTNGKLIKEIRGRAGIKDEYTIITTYEGKVRKKVETFFAGGQPAYKTIYFGNSELADSSQLYYYSDLENEFKFNLSLFYNYDDVGRVLEEKIRIRHGIMVNRTYQYDGIQLTAICAPVTIGENCIKNIYQADGKLSSIYSSYPEQPDKLMEEYFYEGDLLKEKRVYTYVAYDPNNLVNILAIQYIYE